MRTLAIAHLRTHPLRSSLTVLLAVVSILLLAFWAFSAFSSSTASQAIKFDRDRDAQTTAFPPLDDLLDRHRLWPPDLAQSLCSLKIYVYTFPSHLRLPQSTINQCRWSAYNSELLLHGLLTENKTSTTSPLITNNPTEADVFFIPLFPACYLFKCWVAAGWKKALRCGVEDEYILPAMEWVKEQGFWDRNNGSDHLIIHPMDFIDGYYTEEARLAMNSSAYLVTVGDLRPPPYSSHYRRNRDIVIPSSTHLLNSYYINPRDYVDVNGHPYPKGPLPVRQMDGSEIFLPSSGKDYWLSPSLKNRKTIAVFRGGIGRPGEGESYALSIRSLFFPSANTTPPHLSHAGFSSIPSWDIAEWSENEDYARILSRSKFGLAPPGYTLDTTRIYEYFAFGVVPVFIGTGHRGGQVMPFVDDFDYSSFSIFVPRSEAHMLPSILAAISDDEYERLRRKVWEIGRLLVLEGGRGNVWRWIARDLCRMQGVGMGTSVIEYT
ncbi:hypothetical protein T439DRAFT_310624 [Meredithblackwellia eburnea MCA 4105]